jgi:hypothetical protein
MSYQFEGYVFCFRTFPKLRVVFSLALMLFAFSGLAHAQGLGSVAGNVSDPSGAAIVSATVTIVESDTGLTRSVTTGSDGHFLIPSLRPAGYRLTVEAPGFRRFAQTGITLQADQAATVNVKLEIGAATESVTVEASAVQVDTSTETLRQVVDNSRMIAMPLNGRNAAELTALVAGAVIAPPSQADQGKTKTFPVAVTISTNGTRQNQTSYRLDGAENIDNLSNVNAPFPAPDALQEFSVQTSNYSAEFGQNAGGVVNVVTKSGTNQFHGDVYGFLRNSALNARNFFAAERDPLKRSQFGGTIGGPIIKDKTFFFTEYQGTRVRSNFGGRSAFVPTPANLAGDFSAYLSAGNPNNPAAKVVQIKDPTNGLPFPNNQIPVKRFDPASLNVAKLLPQAGGNGSAFFTNPDIENFDETMIRVDHTFSSKDHVFVRYFWDRYDFSPVLSSDNILTYQTGSHIPYQNTVLRETHIFRPDLLNDFRFSYFREGDTRTPPTTAPNLADFGVTGLWEPAEKNIESLNASGFFSFGDSSQAYIPRQMFAWSDDLRWVRGRHSLSIGGAFERDRFDLDTLFHTVPNITFSGDSTGSALTDFMLGRMRTFVQSNGLRMRLRNIMTSLYVQDSIRLHTRFTLNIGLRWEPTFPWNDLYGQQDIFRAADYYAGKKTAQFSNAPPGLFFPGDPGVPKNGNYPDWKNFAPRLGFAYDVFGNGKTSLRGGAGVFFDARIVGYYNFHLVNTPWSETVSLTSPAGPFSNPYLGITNPFPLPRVPAPNAPFPKPVLVVTWDPAGRYVTPTIYQWNLSLEHQLAPDWLVRGAYVGTRSTHLNEDMELNPASYIPGSSLSTDNRRPFQGYSGIQQGVETANSSYHALQLSLEKRFTHGLTILANYTFSKSLDNLSLNRNVASFGLSSYAVLPYYFPDAKQFDRGPSDFDRTQRFVSSYVWQPPVPSGAHRLVRQLLGNWEIGGIASAQTGDPLTVVAGLDRSQTALGKDRGVYVGGAMIGPGACKKTAPCVDYINPSAFALPAIGTFGNVAKGTIRGPGSLNFDMNFSKSFPIGERVRLQFRAEFFNVFNHANYLDPGTANSTKGSSSAYTAANGVSANAAGFGSIRAAYDPRITQLALKVVF